MQITLDIKENTIKDFGLYQIRSFFEKQLQLLELQLQAKKISEALSQSKSVDWESEFEKAREDAWVEYKTSFLNNVPK